MQVVTVIEHFGCVYTQTLEEA